MSRHSSYVDVKLSHIGHNISLIREKYAPEATIIAMVKGDAYGHGLVPVSTYMHARCGIRHFGVAALGEALALLEGSPALAADPDVAIVVFSDPELLNPELRKHYAEQNGKTTPAAKLWPVIGNQATLEAFCAERTTAFAGVPLCLKVNTGMNRLGLTLAQLEEALPLLASAGGVQLLVQHFSVSGMVDHPNTRRQYENFQKAKAMLRAAGVPLEATSAANSGAIEQRLAVDETFVRPGLMLYGPPSINPAMLTPETAAQMDLWQGRAAGYLRTRIIHHYAAMPGDSIGYGYSHNLLTEAAVIVLIPLGYADGFLRYYTGMPVEVPLAAPAETPVGRITSVTGKVFGNVNMDMAAIAIYPHSVQLETETLLGLIRDESPVLVWGDDVSAKAVAVHSIPYQLMTALTTRVPRVYSE